MACCWSGLIPPSTLPTWPPSETPSCKFCCLQPIPSVPCLALIHMELPWPFAMSAHKDMHMWLQQHVNSQRSTCMLGFACWVLHAGSCMLRAFLASSLYIITVICSHVFFSLKFLGVRYKSSSHDCCHLVSLLLCLRIMGVTSTSTSVHLPICRKFQKRAEIQLSARACKLLYIVVDLSPVTDIDASAVHFLMVSCLSPLVMPWLLSVHEHR